MRRHLEEGHELLLPRRSSSVAAASAPSQQQQQATAVSRDDERSTGAFLLKLFPHSMSLEFFTRSVISPTFQPISICIQYMKELRVSPPCACGFLFFIINELVGP